MFYIIIDRFDHIDTEKELIKINHDSNIELPLCYQMLTSAIKSTFGVDQ